MKSKYFNSYSIIKLYFILNSLDHIETRLDVYKLKLKLEFKQQLTRNIKCGLWLMVYDIKTNNYYDLLKTNKV